MRYDIGFELTTDDQVALRRYLIEERGLARDQLRAAWRRVVIINTIMGVLVGVWLTGSYGNRFGFGGAAGHALTFLVATTLFLAISGTFLWVVRAALGGAKGERERALSRLRQRIEADRDAAPRGDYTLSLDERGVSEQLAGEERFVPWSDVVGATLWKQYVMIDLTEGLAMPIRKDAIDTPDELEALVAAIDEWAR